jgi:nucleotide-binding universal stress UspA family protein
MQGGIREEGQRDLHQGQRRNRRRLRKVRVETVVIPRINKEVESIRALGPPDEEAEAIVDAAEEALEKGEEDPKSLLEEESAGPFAKVNKLSREYGLTVCGSEAGGGEEGE